MREKEKGRKEKENKTVGRAGGKQTRNSRRKKGDRRRKSKERARERQPKKDLKGA